MTWPLWSAPASRRVRPQNHEGFIHSGTSPTPRTRVVSGCGLWSVEAEKRLTNNGRGVRGWGDGGVPTQLSHTMRRSPGASALGLSRPVSVTKSDRLCRSRAPQYPTRTRSRAQAPLPPPIFVFVPPPTRPLQIARPPTRMRDKKRSACVIEAKQRRGNESVTRKAARRRHVDAHNTSLLRAERRAWTQALGRGSRPCRLTQVSLTLGASLPLSSRRSYCLTQVSLTLNTCLLLVDAGHPFT